MPRVRKPAPAPRQEILIDAFPGYAGKKVTKKLQDRVKLRPLARRKTVSVIYESIRKQDELPLDYMLRVMRDKKQPDQRRDAMAVAAAPYVHPKLAAVQFNPSDRPGDGAKDVTELSDLLAYFSSRLSESQSAGERPVLENGDARDSEKVTIRVAEVLGETKPATAK